MGAAFLDTRSSSVVVLRFLPFEKCNDGVGLGTEHLAHIAYGDVPGLRSLTAE